MSDEHKEYCSFVKLHLHSSFTEEMNFEEAKARVLNFLSNNLTVPIAESKTFELLNVSADAVPIDEHGSHQSTSSQESLPLPSSIPPGLENEISLIMIGKALDLLSYSQLQDVMALCKERLDGIN